MGCILKLLVQTYHLIFDGARRFYSYDAMVITAIEEYAMSGLLRNAAYIHPADDWIVVGQNGVFFQIGNGFEFGGMQNVIYPE